MWIPPSLYLLQVIRIAYNWKYPLAIWYHKTILLSIKKTEVVKQGNTINSVTQSSRSVTISIYDEWLKVNHKKEANYSLMAQRPDSNTVGRSASNNKIPYKEPIVNKTTEPSPCLLQKNRRRHW